MKLTIVGGPPSVGKTAVVGHVLAHLRAAGRVAGVAKLDCLVANEAQLFERQGVPVTVGLAGYLCPDHFLATNIDRIAAWGLRQRLDLLVVESAGLCNRCSPYLRGLLAVAVMDVLSGVAAVQKVGPLLKAADLVLLTRGDLVSQAERDVVRLRVAELNRGAKILEVNGLTGQGARLIARLFEAGADYVPGAELSLRFSMPAAVCSFCLGEKRVGDAFARGNVHLMELPGEPSPADAPR